MDLDLTDEQELISETARRFADEYVIPRVRESDRAQRFDLELARKLGEMGYLGAPVAEQYGGRGLEPRHLRPDRRADRPRRQQPRGP
ncbi:MAG: acyl-CoA dehydrogenase family protein [Solirubrobacterales bacterium]